MTHLEQVQVVLQVKLHQLVEVLKRNMKKEGGTRNLRWVEQLPRNKSTNSIINIKILSNI